MDTLNRVLIVIRETLAAWLRVPWRDLQELTRLMRESWRVYLKPLIERKIRLRS